MKKYSLILFFWVGSLVATFAQYGWPPVYSMNTDSAFVTLDTAHFQLLEDKQGNFTWKQVQRSTAFHQDSYYNPSRRSHVYWLRMRIKNTRSHDLNLYLCDFNSDYIDMYWIDSSQYWRHQRTGSLIPRSQLPDHKGNKERNRLFFRLPAGQQTTIYQRSESVLWRSPLTYLAAQFQTEEGRVNAVFRDIRVEKGWQDYWFAGIAIGILFLAVCYNLLIFFSTKEQVYLYFSICLLFFVLDRNTTYIQFTFFDEQPYLFRLIANSFFILFFVFFVRSVQRFSQPVHTLSRLSKAITLMLGLTALVNLLQVLSFQYSVLSFRETDLVVEVAIRVVYSLCMILSYRMMKQGTADARFVFIAITPLFIWWTFTLATGIVSLYYQINLSQKLPDIFQYAESACLAWMIIFFSGALINRYNVTRQQVAQQAIEREQLEKEREIERNRIIASQNEQLEQQVKERTAELRQSLEILTATQTQLVQKEKLASLGELTAGIAHEIQNPLNFVNNFSEVSIELIDELREEQQKANRDKELEGEILTDLQQNLQKINQHGNRAGAIIRGMLEHSRASSGEKQPANLNALAEEYLRLAYHGLRAKDKSFNCQLITHFDPAIGNANIVGQDIGRVLLNLYNNAFYAVQKAHQNGNSIDTKDYQPTVWVSTRASDSNTAEIHVRDNGIGIPVALKQKVFQPFFTTKPTGQGTGLGLSLSYDIITKGHGGELIVESREGEGTEFLIKLPMT